MRSQRRYVNQDGTSNLKSSFLSCEKDMETIVRRLFVDSFPYSDDLKRLLVIDKKDCLDNRTNTEYNTIIDNMSVGKLIEEGYVKLQPKIPLAEFNKVQSYIVISFDNFVPSENPHFRDCILMIDVLCHTDFWDLGDYRQRPLKIAGYIDGILDNSRMSGIGKVQFAGCNELILNENLAGYCLMYRTTHAEDDIEDIG